MEAVQKRYYYCLYRLSCCTVQAKGGFYYSQAELQTMTDQIGMVSDLQFPGVVLGCLDSHDRIDEEATLRLMQAAGDMDVTFHRAFDLVPDVFEALDTLKELGIQRILTSGGPGGASENIGTLTELVEEAKRELIIMPGGGIRPDNIRAIMETGATEYHSSCLRSGETITQPEMVKRLRREFCPEGIPLGQN